MVFHFTENGVTLLRNDDREFGKSTGDFGAATSADLANDVKSALEYLKQEKKSIQTKLVLPATAKVALLRLWLP